MYVYVCRYAEYAKLWKCIWNPTVFSNTATASVPSHKKLNRMWQPQHIFTGFWEALILLALDHEAEWNMVKKVEEHEGK